MAQYVVGGMIQPGKSGVTRRGQRMVEWNENSAAGTSATADPHDTADTEINIDIVQTFAPVVFLFLRAVLEEHKKETE